ncbi:HAD family hydrolase [Clostridium paridis]|uniref:HAD family hydrolase n=1 Tax=Clostridium paridis TaxID=2803863 RepID=A0A937FI28_9CLOT|nr:HAD family hydrolase [Clostridium paridis]MBL4933533.1 HAD family hydrolase [Clostridium paridis]
MKLDSIIFDLDGTIWDSTSSIIDCWNKTLDKYDEVNNKLTIDDMKGIMGLTQEEVGKKLFPYLDDAKKAEIMEDCCKRECEHLEQSGAILYDKVEETLEKLSKKYNLFIVSNCQCGYIEAFYKYHGLEKYFKDHESSGNTGLNKGENIKLIIERNNLKASVYVGDTEGDLKATKVAGIPFVYARYGFGDVEEYDYVIDSFQDLLMFI